MHTKPKTCYKNKNTRQTFTMGNLAEFSEVRY